MAGEDEREDFSEDIFEDLDKYFAPIDEVEWPQEQPAEDEGFSTEPTEEEAPVETEAPVQEEAPVEADEQIEPAAPLSAEEAAEVFEEAGAEEEETPGGFDFEPAAASSITPGEPTAEMSGEDWGRLRDVLGEDESQEYAFQRPVEEGGGPGLELEDLKKAPPQYAELPGPGDEERESAEEAASVFAGEPFTIEDESGLGEERIVDVEAVAERLAEGLRTEGEMPVAPRGTAAPPREELAPVGPRTVRVGEETLGGPTWEEPSSGAMEEAPETTARDVPAAIITAAVLVGAGLLAIWYSKAAFAIVGGIVVLIAQAELYATMQRRGYQPATALGLVIGAMMMAGAYLRGEQGALAFVALGLVLTFFWYMAAPPRAREAVLKNIGATMLGIVYLPLLAGYVLIMLSFAGGKGLVLAIIGLTALYDVAAFAVGSFIGRRPLAPTISPKKSWEGLFGASVVTLLVGVALLPSIDPISSAVGRAVALALVIVVFAPLGDLAESLLKRDLRVKDMGTMLPGHGGVLDRIDSVLFVAPAAFYLLRLIL